MSEPLLSLRNVNLSFGGLKAVSDFHIDLFPNQIVSLIGPNGAGKTTVFNLISGVYPPDSGTILFEGISLAGKRPSKISTMGLTRTFQNIRLFKNLSVLDNVRVACHVHHTYNFFDSIFRPKHYWDEEADTHRRAVELLEVFALQDRAYEKASNLPYGEQRKLEIVRALATEPKALLLDEPAAGMNNQETTSLLATIRQVRDRFSLAILLIEHDMKLVMEISERVTVLDYGIVIAEGAPGEVQKNPKVIEAYLGAGDE